MALLTHYSETIRQLLTTYQQFALHAGDQNHELIFDSANNHYLLMAVGWDGEERLYHTVLHVDIIDGKIWIQRDGTEDGIIDDLLAAGVPKEHIVQAYRSPFVRQFTEFAVS
jgi:hypothetical protein